MTFQRRLGLEPAGFGLGATGRAPMHRAMTGADDDLRPLPGLASPPPDNDAIRELIARLEALLREPAENSDAMLRVGPLELDLIERAAKRAGRAIDLLPREFRLLEYMMRHKEQVLTRGMLLQNVWNYKFVTKTNLIDVHMGRLRRKVDRSNEPPMIYNVRGAGFILRAPAQGSPS
jgi:DNA-binding winged helix-turn-helix (wHTH) protein